MSYFPYPFCDCHGFVKVVTASKIEAKKIWPFKLPILRKRRFAPLNTQFTRHSCKFGDVTKALHNGRKLLPLSNMVVEFIVHSSRKFN